MLSLPICFTPIPIYLAIRSILICTESICTLPISTAKSANANIKNMLAISKLRPLTTFNFSFRYLAGKIFYHCWG